MRVRIATRPREVGALAEGVLENPLEPLVAALRVPIDLVEHQLRRAAIELQRGDLVIEVRALGEAPADTGILHPGRPCEAPGQRRRGPREPDTNGAALARVQRIAVWRTDRLVDATSRAGPTWERDVGQIGMVNVAGEHPDRGRRVAVLTGRQLPQQPGQPLEGI